MYQVLHCEDNRMFREAVIDALELDLPSDQYKITSVPSVREGLIRITGIPLDNLDEVSFKTVLQAMKEGNPNYDLLKLVITDGELIDNLEGNKKGILDGWDLAQILRETGYQGRLVYLGGRPIPPGKETFFSDTPGKSNVTKLYDIIEEILQ